MAKIKSFDGPVAWDGERYVAMPDDGHDLLTEQDIRSLPTVVVHDGQFVLADDVPADED